MLGRTGVLAGEGAGLVVVGEEEGVGADRGRGVGE